MSGLEFSVFAATRDHTGERPYWDGATRTFYWIDVFGRRFHRCDATGGNIETFALPAFVGSLAVIDPAQVLLALHNGFFRYDTERGTAELICYPDEQAAGNLRLNDGKVDARGRFVCGGADFFRASPIAGIYSLDQTLKVTRIGGGITLFNGLCWSGDGRTMYYSDSALRRTYACDYDVESGEAGPPRLLAQFEEADGLPDGAAVDTEGCVWIAMVYGGQLVRLAPDGAIERRVAFPVRGPTSLAFGGDALETLFVTSKSIGRDGLPLDMDKGGGSVFRLDGAPCPGLPERRFAPAGATAAP